MLFYCVIGVAVSLAAELVFATAAAADAAAAREGSLTESTHTQLLQDADNTA